MLKSEDDILYAYPNSVLPGFHKLQVDITLFRFFQDLTKEHPDHVILEITNGSIRLSLNTGLDTATAKLGSGLNDGAWHQITVQISGSQATLYIDKDTCGAVCSSVAVSTSSDGTSQFFGQPYFGGVRRLVPQIKHQLVTDGSFVGCIKVFIVRRERITKECQVHV